MTSPSEDFLWPFRGGASLAEPVVDRWHVQRYQSFVVSLPHPAAPQGSPALETQAGESQACDGGISGSSCEVAQQEVNSFRDRPTATAGNLSKTSRGNRAYASSTRITLTSLTLVSVGPVSRRSPVAVKKAAASLLSR